MKASGEQSIKRWNNFKIIFVQYVDSTKTYSVVKAEIKGHSFIFYLIRLGRGGTNWLSHTGNFERGISQKIFMGHSHWHLLTYQNKVHLNIH